MNMSNNIAFKTFIFGLTFIANSPSCLAAECMPLVSKFSFSAPNPDYVKQIENHKRDCRSRPDASDTAAYQECLRAGYTALGLMGNFVAAERLAVLFCEMGHPELSKVWMNPIINSPDAPDRDKAIAQEGLQVLEGGD